MNDNQVILRIALDEGKTQEQLEKVTTQLAKTRDEQKALTKARELGLLSEEGYGKEAVKLAASLKKQQDEQRSLTKSLELWRSVAEDTNGTYKSTQDALALAQQQFQKTAGSQDLSTEAARALNDVIGKLRQQLLETDKASGLYARQIGNYPQLSEEARAGLAAVATELDSLKQAQVEAAKQGGPVAPDAVRRIQELEEQLASAKVANTTYGTSVVDLKRKLSDLVAARDLSQDTKAVGKLNAAILETRGALQEATGKVDEFGDKIEKNTKKEELATLGDAFGGVTAAIQLSSLAMVDQEDAELATAKATQILAQAEALRNLQIGIASAKDALAIGLAKAKNLLFTEQAAAVSATTTATAVNTVATTAQTTATGSATLAQRALNLAMTLNPIGLVVVAVGALVGAYFAWRNASDSTQKKVKDITETVLRFGTPIGLVVTGLQKLYEKSETVRVVLKPLGEAFDFVAGKVGTVAREAGEAIGLLDTAAQKAAKVSAAAVENSEKEIASYQLRARELEKAGFAIESYRSTEREGFIKHLADMEQDNANQKAVLASELAAIDAKKAANETLSKSEQKVYDERREREQKIAEARLALADFDQATQDKVEAREKAVAEARKKELTEAKSASEKAKKLAEQELKDAYTARAKLLENRQQQIARALELTREGSEEELKLLREQATNAARIQLANNSAAQVGASKKEAAALVAARKEIVANGQAAELKQVTQFAQKRALTAFQASLDNLGTELAGVQESSDKEVQIKAQAITAQLNLDLQALDKRKDLQAREAQENRLRAEAQQKIAELEYQQSLRKLEAFFDEREQLLKADYDAGILSEKKYQAALLASQQARVEAGKVLNQDYNRSNAELTRKGQELDAQLTASYKAEVQQRIAAGQQFGEQVGQLFADVLTDQGKSLQDFTAGVLLLLLDTLEKQMLATVGATVFKSTAESLATPQSALTAGAAGFAQAALISAAIVAAFEVGKGLIKANLTPSKQFAQGTVLSGPSHALGGIQLYSPGGHWWGEGEGGEAIINRKSTALFLPVLSAINQAGGGRALTMPGVNTMPHFALGGLSAPVIREGLRGQDAAPYNYSQLGRVLADELRRNPPRNVWSDFKAAEKRNNELERDTSR